MRKSNHLVWVEPMESRVLLSTARVALVSDFGTLQQSEADVANLIKGWNAQSPLDAIVTSGDNDQVNGDDYVNRVGNYYDEFIYGRGSATQRFLPVPGNHDWGSNTSRWTLEFYEEFFTIPDASQGNTSGNERYYNYRVGDIEFFMLDSDTHEPDGTSSTSVQAQWFKNAIAQSTAPWQIVSFHHTAYSSSSHGGATWMQWPFQDWGADLVVSGHNHVYERVNVNGLRFVTNGVGGYDGLNSFGTPIEGSEVRYNAENGAILLEANATSLSYQFINTRDEVIDTYSTTNVQLPNIAVSATNASEAGQVGGFTFTRSTILSGDVTVNYTLTGSAVSGTDFEPIALSVVIPDGVTSVNVPLTAINDALAEGDESVVLTIVDDPSYLRRNTTATATIVDDDMQTATFTQGVDSNLSEYAPNTSYATATSLTVDNDDPSGSGKKAQALLKFNDLIGSNLGQIPFGSTILSATLQLNVNNVGNTVNLHRMMTGWADSDTWNSLGSGVQIGTEAASGADASFAPSATGLYSPDVTSSLQAWLANPSSNFGWVLTPTGTDGVDFESFEGSVKPKLVVNYAPGTPMPDISVSATDANASEAGDSGAFTITRGRVLSGDVTVNYTLSGSATNGADYVSIPASLVIPDGVTSVTIDVSPINDALAEGNESVVLTLTPDANYNLGTSSATLTIADDDLQTAAFQQGVDSYVHSVNPDTSYATATSLNIDADDPVGSGGIQQALISFPNLIGSTLGQIPLGSTILSATLQLNVTNAGNAVNLHRMTMPWDDSDTWNSLGSGVQIGTEALSSIDAGFTPSATGLYTLDVTSSVQAWLANPSSNFGWVLNPTGTEGVDIDSFEGTVKPQLVVNYAAPPNLPTVSIAISANATEPDTSGSFVVTRTGDTTSDLNVYFSVSGSATANSDYLPFGTSVVIPAGAASAEVLVMVLDDLLYEGDELVEVTLASGTGYLLSTNTQATLTISDNELPPSIINVSAAVGAAEPTTPGQFIVTRDGDLTSPLPISYTVGGSATAGVDYVPLSGIVEIAVGARSAVIDLSVLDDSIYEGDEDVVLMISPSTHYVVGTPASATILVVDNEFPPPTVSISASDATAAEPSDSGQFVITRSGDTSSDLTVYYGIGGTATNGMDYATLSGSVLIPVGAASAVIDVAPVDDGLVEFSETVVLAIRVDPNYEIGSGSATVTLADDDLRVVSVQQVIDTNLLARSPDTSYATATPLTVNTDQRRPTKNAQALLRFDNLFGGNAGQIPVGSTILSAKLELNVTDPGTGVNLHRMLVGWSASATWNSFASGVQFDGSEALALADAVFTPSTAGVYAIDVTGSLQAWAAAPTSNFGWVFINSGADAVNFGSSEGNVKPKLVVEYASPAPLPTVMIAANDALASEAGDPAQFTITRSGDLSSSLSVFYTIGGTATAGSDYASLSGSALIAAGAVSATIDLSPLEDAIYEGEESVILTLSDGMGYTIGSSSLATASIADNELPPPVVSVAAIAATAGEPNGAARFEVTRAGDTSTDLTVFYGAGGTATAGTDYTALGGFVVILAGTSSVAIDLSVVDDQVFEGDETVVVTLAENPAYDVGLVNAATAIITDNELPPPTLNISASDATAAEPSDSGQFIITRSGDTNSALTVYYGVGGTATAGVDHTALGGSVVMPAGEASAVIDLSVLDDAIYEGDETVVVTLVSHPAYALGDVANATVTIGDDELPPPPPPTVTIAASPATITEAGGFGTFVMTRAGEITNDVTVFYNVGGAATAGVDYSALSGSVTIPAGFDSAVVSLSALDDTAYEGDESVSLSLAAGEGYVLDPTITASMIIADDELPPPVVTIAATTPTAYEAGGNGVFTVTRVGDTSTDLLVSYNASGTATAGTDYDVLSGTVIIPAGQTSAVFSVTPINDTECETDETVLVTLTEGTAYDVDTSSSATVTIISDDQQPVAPAAPTDLKGQASNGGVIALTWVDNATNELGYVIEWSQDGINWTSLTELGENTSSYTVSGLSKAAFYYFRVKAVNSFGDSAYSNMLKIRTTNK